MKNEFKNKSKKMNKAIKIALCTTLVATTIGLAATFQKSSAYAAGRCDRQFHDEPYLDQFDRDLCKVNQIGAERRIVEKRKIQKKEKKIKSKSKSKKINIKKSNPKTKKEKDEAMITKFLLLGCLGLGGVAGAYKGVSSFKEGLENRKENKASLATKFAIAVGPRMVAGLALGYMASFVAATYFSIVGIKLGTAFLVTTGVVAKILNSEEAPRPKM